MSYQAVIERSLANAQNHVSRGLEIIERQRVLIANLERDGHNSSEARKLLTLFEDIQDMHIADRDRLQRTLDTF